jgi:hypothetical protein
MIWSFENLIYLVDNIFFPQEWWWCGTDGHGERLSNNTEEYRFHDDWGEWHTAKAGGRYDDYRGPDWYGYENDSEEIDELLEFRLNGVSEGNPRIRKLFKKWSMGFKDREWPDKPEKKEKGEYFFTYAVSPKKRIKVVEFEVLKMCRFLEKVFKNKKFYKEYHYQIESGKNENLQNLHFHLVIKFKPEERNNFKRDMVRAWNSMYKNNPIDWKNGIKWKRYNKFYEDKLKYLDNSKKNEFGDDHTNYRDLRVDYPQTFGSFFTTQKNN